ncbi:phosphatidate cytidylyltransferase [Bombella sp. TMW 2.2559]|uniref:Phosphatidate cytidylyltransferase n=1 Tax=Bombella dulcis TaxID=2967339 RepID=A0ABT3WD22_9PROT|nr:phosphatidate cytidylyltransferase [Bombella dulcis]MCX5615493.1 phosphatidate cytidylyltransferase [Bombella dulcis]
MTELQKRILSSLVIVPVVVLCLWFGGWAYRALVLLVMVGIVWEGETLLGQPMKGLRGLLLLFWPVCGGLIAIKGQWFPAFYLLASGVLFGRRTCGPVLVAMLGGFSLLWLRGRPEGLYETFFVIFAVIASDSCAYAAGRLIGGPKLAPAISPGKTISGSLGGVAGAVILGGGIGYWSGHGWSVSACVTGGILAVAAQIGDLLESAFKRWLGVKDSGRLIPGHGGLLDRLDALLLAAPVAAALALMAGSGPFWQLFR